jgi:O-antigen/teichoic acid export membrane protein
MADKLTMNKYRRLGKNTLLVFVGNSGARLMSLIMLPFYTRWLSVEDYGTSDIINVYVSLLLGLVTACITESVFIFPKGKPIEKQKNYFSSGLVFAICSLFLTAILFKVVKIFFTANRIANSFTQSTWLIYGLMVANFLQQYVQQFTRSIDKMKVYSATGVTITVSTATFSFFIIPQWGVFGYVLALIFANFTGMLYSFLCSGAYKYFSVKMVKKSACFEMLKYSIPLMPNNMMWWLVGALNRPIMEQYLGMHSVGIFAVANKFPGIVSLLFSVFGLSWQISVLEEFGKEGYNRFFNMVLRLVALGLFLLFFVMAICSKLIIRIFVAPDFYDASKYVALLTLGAVFSCLAGVVGSNFSAIHQSKYFFYSSIWSSICAVVGNVILIPAFGIVGASITVTISFLVLLISRTIYAWSYVKIQNAKIYLLMITLGILSIIVMFNIQIFVLQYGIVIFLCLLLIVINKDLKIYFNAILKYIENKIKINAR